MIIGVLQGKQQLTVIKSLSKSWGSSGQEQKKKKPGCDKVTITKYKYI